MDRKCSEPPIGIFDSGVGGLSVLRSIRDELPNESLIYLADQAHVPYGSRQLEEVRNFSEVITQFLLDQGAKLIVIACNTASAAALFHLRDKYPTIPFVGMEPAVKPAAEMTRSGVVGVLATPSTFQGVLYASVVERFANNVQILQDTCPGLVNQIETGQLNSPGTQVILDNALKPMIEKGVDTVVLGCTHYPFVIPLIQEIVGPEIRVIDPSPAIARQVSRLLNQNHILAKTRRKQKRNPRILFYSTGTPENLESLLPELIGINGHVKQLYWNSEELLTYKPSG